MIDIVVQKGKGFIPKAVSRDQAKDTGMALTLVCLLIGYLGNRKQFLLAALVILLITMLVPRVLNPAAKLWFGLSHLLGTIMSNIMMAVLFFIIVTPIGLLMRLTGHDTLQLKKWKKDRGSVFKIREHTFTEHDIKHPY